LETAYVVDTTIIVSWLLNPRKLTGKIVRSLELDLYTPYKAIDELWRHQSEWRTRRRGFQISQFIDALQYYVNVVPVDGHWEESRRAADLMEPIDPNDSEFLALAMRMRTPLWSQDKHFEAQKVVKVVTSAEILRMSHELPTLWMALKER
jgi:predicted nucleic acid-binding protein